MLEAADYAVLAAYLAVVAGIGVWGGRGQRTTEDHFLGGRKVPWFLAGLSIIATETSALTFMGAPVQSLRGDWGYVQLAIGSVLGRFVVAGLLIGLYYRARVWTVYEYLERRFGVLSRNGATLLFFIGRSLGSGVRLYGAAIALVVVTQMPFPQAIALIGVVAVAYTIVGGIRSVIWTDALQGLLLFVGGTVALVSLVQGADVGPAEAVRILSENGKLDVFDLDFDLKKSYTLWGGVIGVMFLTMATHGTDQDMIQRALTCRGEAGGRKSLWLSAALVFPVVFLFLSIGSMLWLRLDGDEAAYRAAAELAARAGEARPEKGFDYLFPSFVLSTLPAGLKGLLVAAIFAAAMSSLDSAIAALSSTAVTCVWKPYVAPDREDRYYLRVSRVFVVVFAVILGGVAVAAWLSPSSGDAAQGFGVLMLGLKALTWIFPPLLGIFLLGALTSRGADGGNLVALTLSVGLLIMVEWWGSLFGGTPPFGWIWNAPIGCLTSFGIGALFTRRDG